LFKVDYVWSVSISNLVLNLLLKIPLELRAPHLTNSHTMVHIIRLQSHWLHELSTS